jgi:hypothetical protein
MADDRAGSRPVAIWELVAGRAASRGARASLADVCAVAVAAARVSGAGLTATTTAARAGHVMCVTGELGEKIEELQLTLGEGPSVDASASFGPVLIPDLGTQHAGRRWPGFASAAFRAGVAAIFAFPLQIGAIRVGVLDLYRDQPGPLSDHEFGDALILADAATLLLLDGQDHDQDWAAGSLMAQNGPGGQPADLALHRAEIDQATGMLTEQLRTGIEDAFVRLRAYAYAHDRQLADVARDIVGRRLRLRPDRSEHG